MCFWLLYLSETKIRDQQLDISKNNSCCLLICENVLLILCSHKCVEHSKVFCPRIYLQVSKFAWDYLFLKHEKSVSKRFLIFFFTNWPLYPDAEPVEQYTERLSFENVSFVFLLACWENTSYLYSVSEWVYTAGKHNRWRFV